MEPSEAQNQMAIRSAKAAILLSFVNRKLRSSISHRRQSEGFTVMKLKREVEVLRIELMREKMKSKKMEFLHLQISFLTCCSSKFLKQDSSNLSALAGTYGYIAPELAYSMKVTEKCDVYSFGVLAVVVIKGEYDSVLITSILSSLDDEMLPKGVVDQRLPSLSPDMEKVVVSILVMTKECLNANPQARPTMHHVSKLLIRLSSSVLLKGSV